MNSYSDFKSEDPLHITSFKYDSINYVAEIIQEKFSKIGRSGVKIKPSASKDVVQLDKRNEADDYITKWWKPKTSLEQGIIKVFEEMKNDRI